MSRYFSRNYASLVPYTPGEQPQNRQYIKLNTNESPFPPSENAIRAAAEELDKLMLYSDPECKLLRQAYAELIGVKPENLVAVNGSDEVLNFAFMAFCDATHPAIFPDITYGFYPVYAEANHIPYEEIPLDENYRIRLADYCGANKTIFIANPNAPTGIALTHAECEEIIRTNPDSIVVIDEAYVDFGGESCVDLIGKYDNLFITQTFSKSRSMAGARLGFGIACEALINDINTLRYSTNPYNVNRMTMAAGIGAIRDEAAIRANCAAVAETREWTKAELERLGFACTESRANFLFACHPQLDGKRLYEQLKERGVLIRHFDKERIRNYNRITIGSKEQMQILIDKIGELL